jgi:hypothetical protein
MGGSRARRRGLRNVGGGGRRSRPWPALPAHVGIIGLLGMVATHAEESTALRASIAERGTRAAHRLVTAAALLEGGVHLAPARLVNDARDAAHAEEDRSAGGPHVTPCAHRAGATGHVQPLDRELLVEASTSEGHPCQSSEQTAAAPGEREEPLGDRGRAGCGARASGLSCSSVIRTNCRACHRAHARALVSSVSHGSVGATRQARRGPGDRAPGV